MKNLTSLAIILTVAAVISTSAKGQIYDFTFTSSTLDATGTINVANGVATSGSIAVTNVPVEADPSTLLTATGLLIPGSGGVTDQNGDNVIYDNQVNFASNPILDGNGLSFGSGQYSSNGYTTLIALNGGDIYGNIPPIEYTLFVGESTPNNNEYVYAYNSGTLTVTAAPEPSSWVLSLAGVGALALVYLRRGQRNA